MHLLILVLLVLLIVGAFPRWGYNANWGYAPMSVGGIVLIIFVIWLFFLGGARYF